MSAADSGAEITAVKEPAQGISWRRAAPYAAATAVVGLAALVAPVLQRLPHANLSLLFMTGVVFVAVRFGLGPSIYASILSFLTFNFLFTPPYYTFTVNEEGDFATLLFFLVMASLSGNLAARLRDAMKKQQVAILRTAALQDLTREVAGAATREQVLAALAGHISAHFQADAVAESASPATGNRSIVARTGLGRDETSGNAAASTNLSEGVRWPFETARGVTGHVAVSRPGVPAEETEFANALCSQAGVALDRIDLVEELEEAKLLTEREQLRAALLSSVSHDLRTPLASVIGAASSLVAYRHSLNAEDQGELLATILGESERLDRYIQNLLDMTRLGQGSLELQLDWEDLRDIVASAARRLRLGASGHALESDIASDAELVYVHGDLIEQVFVNLLDNAVRCSPPGGPIRVRARREGKSIAIEVTDEGPGIPEPEREKVFDPFYRVRQRDRKSGTGLGLSICRGMIRAHGGSVTAEAPLDGRGARIRIVLPQQEPRVPERPDA